MFGFFSPYILEDAKWEFSAAFSTIRSFGRADARRLVLAEKGDVACLGYIVASSITDVSQEQRDPTTGGPRTEVRNVNRSIRETHTGRSSGWLPTDSLG